MRAHGYQNLKSLADAADVPHSSLYKFVAGTTSLGIETRKKLARALPGGRHLLVADIIGTSDDLPT